MRAEFCRCVESFSFNPDSAVLATGPPVCEIRVVDDETGAAIRGAGCPERPVFFSAPQRVCRSKGV